MNTQATDTLQAGIAALKTGDRAGAMRLLAQAVRSDPNNERAWLFLAGAVADLEQRRSCLERVLQLNPQNEMARKGLASLAQPTATVAPVDPAAAVVPESALPPASTPPPVALPAARVTPPEPPAVMTQAPAAPGSRIVLSPELLGQPQRPAVPPRAPADQPPAALPAQPAARPAPNVAALRQQMLQGKAAKTQPDRLVWSLVLVLGLVLMLASLAYAGYVLNG
ncbi:MAG: tetratricopeptide repeat protein [Chloroflexaceae bacterium]|jgi:hypothetical protein|nr:tetratricopeptide repeat protein [Chloroflexaceae bacterium]